MVSDIGGIMIDVCFLIVGCFVIDLDGVCVGLFCIMVEVVVMCMIGFGGDFEVYFVGEGFKGGVIFGFCCLLFILLVVFDVLEMVYEVLDC